MIKLFGFSRIVRASCPGRSPIEGFACSSGFAYWSMPNLKVCWDWYSGPSRVGIILKHLHVEDPKAVPSRFRRESSFCPVRHGFVARLYIL